MGVRKVKIEGEIYNRARLLAEKAGYSSVDEFIQHVIEKELTKIDEGGDSNEEVEKRLRGLGYIA